LRIVSYKTVKGKTLGVTLQKNGLKALSVKRVRVGEGVKRFLY